MNRAPATAHSAGLRVEHVLIAVVLVLLATSLIYIWGPTSLTPATPPHVNATRLVISGPTTVKVGEVISLRIQAVAQSEDRVDPLRTDVVRVSATPSGAVTPSTSKVTLRNGEATLTVTVVRAGFVTINASWISGYSSLETGALTISAQP